MCPIVVEVVVGQEAHAPQVERQHRWNGAIEERGGMQDDTITAQAHHKVHVFAQPALKGAEREATHGWLASCALITATVSTANQGNKCIEVYVWQLAVEQAKKQSMVAVGR